jgi:uncharacterized lipoprotein YajG
MKTPIVVLCSLILLAAAAGCAPQPTAASQQPMAASQQSTATAPQSPTGADYKARQEGGGGGGSGY